MTTAIIIIAIISVFAFFISKAKKTGGQGNGISPSDPPKEDNGHEKPY